MCMCMCMTTKTISIMEDAYKLLILNKLHNESFSEIIRRTLDKRTDIMKFAGVLKEIDDKEIILMKKDISNLRLRSTKELLEKVR